MDGPASKSKYKKEEIFEFEEKQMNPKSPPYVLQEKKGKKVEAEASMFQRYTPIVKRKQRAKETIGVGETLEVLKATAKRNG